MVFECRITLADRIDKRKYLVFPTPYKNCFHRRIRAGIRALVSRKFSSGIIEHL